MLIFALPFCAAYVDKYAETIGIFSNADDSSRLFDLTYGYAVFPTIGKAGFVAGGAGGKGRVYAGASGGGNDATTRGGCHKGMATFTVAKGGLMAEASIGGASFEHTPR